MKRLDVNPAEEYEMDGLSEDLTEEELAEENRTQAPAILEGIIAAAQNVAEERQEILIKRGGKAYFNLVIQPVSEAEARKLRRKCTKYVKSKVYGTKLPEETDMTKYRSMLIYAATVNRDETWDNKALWKALESRYPIVTGWETVDLVLLPGEKEQVMNAINALSGYTDDDGEELEEVVKN